MALLLGAGIAIPIVYGLIFIALSLPSLRRFSPRLRWHRTLIREGESAVLFSSFDGRRRGAPTIEIAAEWHVRGFTLSGVLGEEVESVPLGRGVYRAERCDLLLSDPFGLIVVRRRIEAPPPVVVAPLPAYREWRVEGGVGGDSGRSGNDPFHRSETLLESRPYRPGDNPLRIAWNAFAHTGEIHVRQGDDVPPPPRKVVIIGDVRSRSTDSAGEIEELDKTMRVLVGLAEEVRGAGFDFIAGWSDGTVLADSAEETILNAAAERYHENHLDRGTIDRLGRPVLWVAPESETVPPGYVHVST